MVFVTGGTGFVGRTIIRKLLERGESVRALYRNRQRCSLEDARLTWVPGEIGSPERLSRAMDGADAVIHLVGRLIEPGSETFEKIHVGGARNMLEAAQRSGLRRFLYMSALGARPEAASRYHQTKWQAEEAVRAAGLDATIFRPSLIFGREDVSINLLSKIISYSPVVPIFGDGQNRLQPVWVEDVADCFLRALDRPVSSGKSYSLCGPRSYTVDELVGLILRVKKRNRLMLRIPAGWLKGPALLAERLFSHPPLTRDQLKMLQEENTCSDPQAGRELGIEFKGMEELLPTYLNE